MHGPWKVHFRVKWPSGPTRKHLDGSNAMHRSGFRGHFFGQSSFSTHALAKTQPRQGSQRLTVGDFGYVGLRHANWSRHCDELVEGFEGLKHCHLRYRGIGLAAVMAAYVVGANPIIGVDHKPKQH